MLLHHRSRRNAGSIAPTVPGLLLLTLALLLLAACGAPAREIATGGPQGVGPATAPASQPTLPTLPPVQSRTPDRFDPNGCLRTSPTASDCAQRAPQLDASAAGSTPQDWRTLAGFVGSQYTSDLTRDASVVLTDTVTTSTGAGRWRAVGLARNEHPRTLAALTVEATLHDAAGNVLETVAATSPVGMIRPGEPVPFALAARLDTSTAAAVARVAWRTVEGPGPTDDRARVVEVNTYWTRPHGDDRQVTMYLHEDRDGARPYLLFGSVTAHATVNRPHVVLAWLSPAGRVLAVHDVDVAAPDAAPAANLAAGSAGDFLVAVDDPVEGPVLSETGPMLWGAGR